MYRKFIRLMENLQKKCAILIILNELGIEKLGGLILDGKFKFGIKGVQSTEELFMVIFVLPRKTIIYGQFTKWGITRYKNFS